MERELPAIAARPFLHSPSGLLYFDSGVLVGLQEDGVSPDIVVALVCGGGIAVFDTTRQTGLYSSPEGCRHEYAVVLRQVGAARLFTPHPNTSYAKLLETKESNWLYLLYISNYEARFWKYDSRTGETVTEIMESFPNRGQIRQFASEHDWLEFLRYRNAGVSDKKTRQDDL